MSPDLATPPRSKRRAKVEIEGSLFSDASCEVSRLMNPANPDRSPWTPPDRLESIRAADTGPVISLAPGVSVRELAGASGQARGLFTGLLTIEPGGSWPSYARPDNEVLILLDGEAEVLLKGEQYRLSPLDHAAIPAFLPRGIVNPSEQRAATFHVSIASANPSLSLEMGAASTPLGSARIGRNAPEARSPLAPGAMFQDFFNASMGMTGICGGYGLFAPGARLPCHRHEFDESITIVEGRATCVVEGRRYELADNATALVPQGRCHYFINQTDAPMAMVWVYAGDMPDRIVLDESFCHPEMGRSA